VSKLIDELKKEIAEITQLKQELKETLQILKEQSVEYENLIRALHKQKPEGIYL